MEPLRPPRLSAVAINPRRENDRVRPDLLGRWHSPAAVVRRLRLAPAARLTMLMILLYAAGGLAIAVYMIAALIRPEKF